MINPQRWAKLKAKAKKKPKPLAGTAEWQALSDRDRLKDKRDPPVVMRLSPEDVLGRKNLT